MFDRSHLCRRDAAPGSMPALGVRRGFRFADTIYVIRAPTIDILASVAQIGAPLPATEEAGRTEDPAHLIAKETIR